MDSLNTIPNSGSFGDISAKLNDNFSKVGQSLTTLENVAIANKGYFDTLASLQAAFPSPKAGNIAYVANVASSTGYYIYNVVSGVWTATTTEAPAVDVEISNYAQHGYSSSPKTLKQVDDEVVQLAGEMEPARSLSIDVETEFKYTIVDSDGYVLFGIRYDGSTYMPRGIPDELSTVLPRLTELVNPLVNEYDLDVDYMYKIVDSNGNVLVGVRHDSTVEFQKIDVFDLSFIDKALTKIDSKKEYGRNFSPIATSFQKENPLTRHIHSKDDMANLPYPRIPALQITSNMNMLVAYELRAIDDDKGEISIYVSRSIDGGGTFTKSSVFQYTPNNRYMNPSFVMDKTGAHGLAGRIYLFAIKIKDDAKYLSALVNKSESDLVYKYTDDDGATWSAEQVLTSLIPENYVSYGSSPANGIQLDNGILVLPAMVSMGISPTSISANYRSGIFYKSPSGQWQFNAINFDNNHHDNESTIINIGNRVLINIRNERDNTRKVYISSEINNSTLADEITWKKRDESGTFSSYGICQGFLSKINYNGDECYLFSMPDYMLSQTQRQFICIWISFDLRRFYPMYYVTTNQISNGYSSISFHPSGVLAVAYENNSSPLPDMALEKQISYQDISFLLNKIPEYKLLVSKYKKDDDLLIYKQIKDLL